MAPSPLELFAPQIDDLPSGGWSVGWSARWTPWLLHGKARTLDDGRFGITELHVQLDGGYDGTSPVYPAGAITSSVTQRLPVGAILEGLRGWIVEDLNLEAVAEHFGFKFSQTAKEGRRLRAEQVTRPRSLGRGRPPLPESELARLAIARLELARRGITRGIHRELARQFGVDVKTIKERLRQTRRAGFLADATPGSRGALPGPRLQEWKDDEP